MKKADGDKWSSVSGGRQRNCQYEMRPISKNKYERVNATRDAKKRGEEKEKWRGLMSNEGRVCNGNEWKKKLTFTS